jgi:enterochelin esterase-like enzyme
MRGKYITRRFDYDGGRLVEIYVPPVAPEAIVFCGDGQPICQWGAHLDAHNVKPTMIVGAYRADAQDEMVRIREYSPDFDPAQFSAHEQFFIGDIRSWVRLQFGLDLPRERTGVAGVSASAELSLAMGLRHPDIFGVVFSASPGGGYKPPSVLPAFLPRTYLTAGTREPFFLENATRWAKALRTAGADVVMTERDGDHGAAFWQAEFINMIGWAFGPCDATAASR